MNIILNKYTISFILTTAITTYLLADHLWAICACSALAINASPFCNFSVRHFEQRSFRKLPYSIVIEMASGIRLQFSYGAGQSRFCRSLLSRVKC